MNAKHFKRRVLQRLTQLNMNQSELEKKLGHHKGWLTARFAGTEVQPKTIHEVAQGLGVETSYFFENEAN